MTYSPQSSKKIAIIGGGISGITLAYFFNKLHPEIDITILEKSHLLGGKLKPQEHQGRMIPMGPKTVVLKENSALEILLKDLQMMDKIIKPHPNAKERFIIDQQKLKALPKKITDFFRSPFLGCLKEILLEPFQPKKAADETVEAFFLRRFGKNVLHYFIHPMMKGIYGGGADFIPISYAFDSLKKMEESFGGIVLGFLRSKKTKRTIFSFEKGLYELVEAIQNQLLAKIHFNFSVEKIVQQQDHVAVYAKSQVLQFDHLFLALDVYHLIQLIPEFSPYFKHGQFQSITQVYIEIDQECPFHGFGCLSLQEDSKPLLGILFDSVIFPHLNPKRFSCTVMLEGDFLEKDAKKIASEMIQKYLQLSHTPQLMVVKNYPHGIFVPGLGFKEAKKSLDEFLNSEFPRISVLEGVFKGVGVADQIDNTYNLVKNFLAKS